MKLARLLKLVIAGTHGAALLSEPAALAPQCFDKYLDKRSVDAAALPSKFRMSRRVSPTPSFNS
jgi:hypothetical protein